MYNIRFSLFKVILLAVISAFTGTAFFVISVGSFHIFPFRLLLIFLWLYTIGKADRVYDLRSIRTKEYLVFLIFWFVYSLFSLVWAADKVSALKQITFLFMNVSFILFMVYYIRNFRQIYSIYKVWLIIHVILLPIAAWVVMSGDHLCSSGLFEVDEGYDFYNFAPTTVFRNQNDYATMIALVFPMLYVGIRYAQKVMAKFFLLLVAVISIVVLFFASSRANYIGLLMGFTFWFFFLLKPHSRFNLLAISILMLIIFTYSLNETNISFLTTVWEDFNVLLEMGSDDAGVDIRSNLIKNGIHFAKMTFGFGVGAGNIEYYMINHPKYFVGDTANVHNWWVEILANFGIIVFVGYILFFLGIFWALYKIYRGKLDREQRIMCEAILCGLVSFPISSLSSSSLLAFGPQWIFFGMALAFINCHRRELIKRRDICTS